MTIDELLLNVKAISFADCVSQADVISEEDLQQLNEKGYRIQLTKEAFCEQFEGIDPECIFYTPSISMNSFYFNPKTLAAAPFHLDFILAGISIGPKDGFRRVFKEAEQLVAEHDYSRSLVSLPDGMQLEFFQKLIELKGKDVPGLYHTFITFYTHADYGFGNLDKATVQAIFDSKTAEEHARTRAALKDLPDLVTIYRGGNTASTPYKKSYSWTLDINIANFFASRRGQGPGYIVEGQVVKEDIIEAMLDSNEQEVLVHPSKVKVVRELTLPGIDLLKDLIPSVKPMYQKYLDEMDELSFSIDSDVHGRDHQARVLLHCLFMAELRGLSSSDRKVLATAAIYHDTRREHDWRDATHGERAVEYYRSQVSKPDPLVEFLIGYHSRPDEEGYQHIIRNRALSKNRSRARLLFNVFKDADGLDRVRLGGSLRELDLKQLRTEAALTLPLIARICLEQIKV